MFEKYVSDWRADAPRLARDFGIVLDARAYLPDEVRHGSIGALDAAIGLPGVAAMYGIDAAQPTLTSGSNSAIPAMLTTFIDPDILRILFAANKAARIMGAEGTGERK